MSIAGMPRRGIGWWEYPLPTRYSRLSVLRRWAILVRVPYGPIKVGRMDGGMIFAGTSTNKASDELVIQSQALPAPPYTVTMRWNWLCASLAKCENAGLTLLDTTGKMTCPKVVSLSHRHLVAS